MPICLFFALSKSEHYELCSRALAAGLTRLSVGTPIALLFIGAMIAIALAFAILLVETRLGARSVRIRTDILEHEVEADESP